MEELEYEIKKYENRIINNGTMINYCLLSIRKEELLT
jgi:hypothetical protein